MISNKTAATLLFIILNMQLAASSSPDDSQKSGSSGKSAPLESQASAHKPEKITLQDMDGTVGVVQPKGGNGEVIGTSKEQPVPQVKSQFGGLIELGNYDEIIRLGGRMSDEEFLKQLCPVVKALEQLGRVFKHLKSRKLMASFYVHGDIGVVGEALADSEDYYGAQPIKDGDLKTALTLALNGDSHDRVIELLKIAEKLGTKRDEGRGNCAMGGGTHFEILVSGFLRLLAPWEDGMALKRFLTLREDELRDKHPVIFVTILQELVEVLSNRLNISNAEKLLIDLIGQPSLLTPATFARGFLYSGLGKRRSNFIKYGWCEAIKEGLTCGFVGAGILWKDMQKVLPGPIIGGYPTTKDALDNALKHISTKKQVEEQWAEKNVPDFSKRLGELTTSAILPTVLVRIVFEYAAPKPTWLDVQVTKSL